MARKNPFASLLNDEAAPPPQEVGAYTVKGASRSLISSIDEMAARAESLLAGETIVELDPAIVDVSFVRDRLADDEEDFAELLAAIRERGQDTPILVRPHPKATGRYMAVFGHRRLRAARELKRKVRAIVREIKDRDHVIAQGQENSVRANLSFIERARFAAQLSTLRYDDDSTTAMAALSIDRATLSKMLSVASLAPEILDAVGAAKSIGRDRWYELKQLLDDPARLAAALVFVRQASFGSHAGDERFNALLAHAKSAKAERPRSAQAKRSWAPTDRALSAEIISEGKRFNLALKAKGADARAFGDYLSENLDRFYEEFRQATDVGKNGD